MSASFFKLSKKLPALLVLALCFASALAYQPVQAVTETDAWSSIRPDSMFITELIALPGISITEVPFTYTQNFDNPPTAMPRNGSVTWTDNSTVPGWSAVRTGTGTVIVASNGSDTTGNLFSYGVGVSIERALGSLGDAGSGDFYYGVCFLNNTGTPVERFLISYDGEQWYNSGAEAQTVNFQYQVASSCQSIDASEGWLAYADLNFTSPVTGGTPRRLNGNETGVVALSSQLGVLVNPGQAITLRWVDPDHAGADHGLAIDNFSITTISNSAPVAYNQTVTTDEDTPVDFTLQAEDPDGGPLTWYVDVPANGALSGTAPNLTYTPDSNWHGSDSFTFYVFDGEHYSNTASVTIHVNPVLDPPSIESSDLSGPYQTGEVQQFQLSLTNPAYGDSFSSVLFHFRILDAVLSDIASLEYYDAGDSLWHPIGLTVYGNDLIGFSGPAAGFALPAPFSGDFAFRAAFNTPGAYAFEISLLDISATPDEVLATFTDTAQVVSALAVTDIDLRVSTDKSTWAAVDGSYSTSWRMGLDTSEDWYYLDTPDVTVNRALVAGYHPFYIQSHPGGFFAYWASRGVVESAAEPWQQAMWEIINGREPFFYLKGSTVEPNYRLVDGLLKLLGQPDEYLRLEGSYLPGYYTFSGEVTDEMGFKDNVLANIILNDIPVAQGQSVQGYRNQSVPITLSAQDLYGNPLIYLLSTPTHGSLSGTAPNILYTPTTPGWMGSDSFTFKVNDGEYDSNEATVSIQILNREPVVGTNNYTTDQNKSLTSTLGVTDADGDVLSFTLHTGAQHGNVVLMANGTFTYTPDLSYLGADSFIFYVSDGYATVQGTANITVAQLPDTDLSITVSATPNPVTAGDSLAYTVTVNNLGPSAAANLHMQLNLPAGVVFSDADGSGWVCGLSGSTVNCQRGSLAAAASTQIIISTIAPQQVGQITATAHIDSSLSDTNLSNNQQSVNTLVVSIPVTGPNAVYLPLVTR